MAKDLSKEIKQIKKDYFDLEETRHDEKESLKRVINTFGVLASSQEDLSEEIKNIKELINDEEELPINRIDKGIQQIKEKIRLREKRGTPGDNGNEPVGIMTERIIEVCRIFRKITAALIDDFYPMADEMESRTENICIDCNKDVTEIDFKQPSESLLYYIDELKLKISNDFRFVNKSFISFLEHVKDLENSFAKEFGGEKPIKQIEYFEIKINDEIGSITETFNIYATINEVKTVVIDKLNNIKELISFKNKEDLRKARIAGENIKKLKTRIDEVEKDAQELSKKAECFQEAAIKDGLTGLYNRNALDIKTDDALKTLKKHDNAFSVIFFDVDRFKEINDNFGHVAGDKVLQKVAQCLRETFRKDDFIARYGGDEFVVIIQGLTREMALKRIDLFRKNLKRRRFVSYKDGEINIGVSAGYCMALSDDTPESLYERADKIMYDSKKKNS